MTNPFDPTTLARAAAEAPEAGSNPVNYGKLYVLPKVTWWVNDPSGATGPDGKPKRKKMERPMESGEQVPPDKRVELHFTVDIQEFNPALTFQYERDVTMENSSARQKTDWSEIVLPSLIATFGETWATAVFQQPYVEVEDAVNVNKKQTSKGVMLNTPKFLRRFASREECVKAHHERYGDKSGGNGSAPASVGGIPAEAIEKTRGLLASLGNNEYMVLTMLAQKPFGDYPPDVLLAAAKKA